MVDRDRILAKLDQMDTTIRELDSLDLEDYQTFLQVRTRRATERILQVAIEAMLDVCHQLVKGLRLGLPAEENDLLVKLVREEILSEQMKSELKQVRGFRNILVHEYGDVDPRIVYEVATKRTDVFVRFKREILAALRELEQ